ncbi:J domain-containing protein [Leifsonia flava]|uniref:Molecular chaperone DnaJ n=1 Tax=Orlajensenia leifsoniae TaxID=2561933 RepID=A0A4Y9R4W7_9MICO|nr:DnaJ domain-containing protein [Leifsonia flava]TFV99681.1 molecular chaperone DnaJ [Leifsonia flava]
MPDSPISATPYEVLGVSPSATDRELKRAFRTLLRQTHPDAGGTAERFHAVQIAWEKIGTPEARAAYDRARPFASADAPPAWSTPQERPRTDSRPTARSFGHPGGWSREYFLDHMREWIGRGETVPDFYDPQLVRSAPREIRHLLANALAEEATARQLSTLGIGFTIWHDVATDAAGSHVPPKIDHIVLGPSGLFAIQSEDWGDPVKVKRGELIGQALGGERPMHDLATRAKSIARGAKVKFTGLVIVVPDGAPAQSLEVLGHARGAVTALVEQSRLPGVLRDGLPGAARINGTELFEVRTRLQENVQHV